MAAEPAIEAHRLVRRFGARVAVSGVDLRVREGEFVTIFGPNGAGKTTLLRVLCGLLKPSTGDVKLLGASISGDPVAAKKRLGFIGHASFLYGGLTAAENLGFYARLYAVNGPRERIEHLLREVGLWDRAADPVRSFSRGMLQRLTIARALLHDPDLIFLDEPFTGLDREAVRTLRRLLETLHGLGRTVLMVTHDIQQGLDLASRVILMSRGEVVDDREAAGLTGQSLEEIYASRVATWSS